MSVLATTVALEAIKEFKKKALYGGKGRAYRSILLTVVLGFKGCIINWIHGNCMHSFTQEKQ